MVNCGSDINNESQRSPQAEYIEQLGMFDALGISSRSKSDILIWESDTDTRKLHFFDQPNHIAMSFSYEELENCTDTEGLDVIKAMTAGAPPDKWQRIEKNVRIFANGTWREFLLRGLLNCINGKNYASGVAFDTQSIYQQRERIEYLESHDSLTGLLNFNSFDDWFERLTRIGMYPLSLVIVKIENLSDACCALGYHASNTLIRNVANVIQDCFFDADIIGRTGSGEYCSAFTGKDQLEIETRVNEATMKLHSTYLNLIKTDVSFGYSIAEYEADFCSMYHEACQRLVKKRNRQMNLSSASVIDRLNTMISRKAGWGKRVVRLQSLSVQIGKALGCKEDVLAETKLLAKIADIGLIGVNDSLLSRRLQLSDEDTTIYNGYIEAGREIINGIDSLAQMDNLYTDVFKRYDEWQDAIAVPARIVAAVRGFDDILLTNGSAAYKELRALLSSCKGKEYCPKVVDLLLDVARKYHKGTSTDSM